MQDLHVIGAGLAGSEAAWQAAQLGLPVVLHEMRPQVGTPAHQTGEPAELVCSNSFRSDDAEANAVGLLHQEMRRLGSLIMAAADAAQVPAGGALAVDRDLFSAQVKDRLQAHNLIKLESGEVTELPRDHPTIVATGPLTSAALSQSVLQVTGEESLAFFDAIAPIVYLDSVKMDKAWFQSRYDKAGPGGTGKDYLNCPLTEEEYNAFLDALLAGEQVQFKQWEQEAPYFEGCLPIEVLAQRGRETLRWGPMKPVGLTPPNGIKPHAVVQLRQDNKLGTLYNLVGFQTKLKYAAQTQILRMIPGLEEARFARLGGLHRNTFLNAPKLLDARLRLKVRPNIRFAGQIAGVEGYVESAGLGLLAGRLAATEILGQRFVPPPEDTALGALLTHVTGGANPETYQPMNVNFGLFPPPVPPAGQTTQNGKQRNLRGRDRKVWLTNRARASLGSWLEDLVAAS